MCFTDKSESERRSGDLNCCLFISLMYKYMYMLPTASPKNKRSFFMWTDVKGILRLDMEEKIFFFWVS